MCSLYGCCCGVVTVPWCSWYGLSLHLTFVCSSVTVTNHFISICQLQSGCKNYVMYVL